MPCVNAVKPVLKISIPYTPVETEEERANENESSIGRLMLETKRQTRQWPSLRSRFIPLSKPLTVGSLAPSYSKGKAAGAGAEG